MGSDGKQRIGPCAHRQVAVVGQFYLCIGAPECDGKQRCRRCASSQVEPFEAPPMVPRGSWHCWSCGACWFDPISPSPH